MRQDFDTQGLKRALEEGLGFRIGTFKRLKCVNSVNFRAVRESDGFVFTVKCLPAWRRFGYDLIVRHLAELEGSRAPRRIFEKECPAKFGDFDLICLAWCDGGPLFPDRLSNEQFLAFLDDYLAFSRVLQRTTGHIRPYPAAEWRAEALARCSTGWGRLVLQEVKACREEESSFRPELLRVTHGDLHPGNFAFSGGRVSGFFDVEGLTQGYPAWDILRYITFSIDHLRFYERFRRRKILKRFAEAVRHLPYSREEWIVSINVTWLEQVHKKLETAKVGFLQAVQLRLHAGLYRELKAIAACSAGR